MYNISKGQVWVLVIGALFLWLLSFNYSFEWWGGFCSIAIPVVVAFYILGWKNFKKEHGQDAFLFSERSKTSVRKALLPSIIIISVIVIVSFSINYQERKRLENSSTPVLNSNTAPLIREVMISKESVISDGYLFKVVVVNDLGRKIDNDFGFTPYSSLETEGKFFEAIFTVVSESTRTKSFNPLGVTVIDVQEREYTPVRILTCDDTLVEHLWSWSAYNLKPGIPCKFRALFEVAGDVTDLFIKIKYRSPGST